MQAAFIISVSYVFLGFLYAPGLNSSVAFVFVAISCLPLLFASTFESRPASNTHHPPAPALFWFVIILGIVNLTVIAISVGYSPLDIISPEGFASIAIASTEKRYSDGGNSGSPVILAISLLLVYRLGAADTAISKTYKMVGFVPLLLYSLLSTEKWPMFLSILFFLAGVFISRDLRRAVAATSGYLLAFGVLGFVLSGVALVLRGFAGDLFDLPEQILHYLFAPTSALGAWIIADAMKLCCTLGALTFIGPLDAFGLVQRSGGVFAENFTIYGLDTNIYTAWRYLVQDFSLAGPFFLNTAIAMLYVALRLTGLWRAATVLSGFTTMSALLSLTVTPFVHNSVLLAILLSLGYTVLSTRRIVDNPSKQLDKVSVVNG